MHVLNSKYLMLNNEFSQYKLNSVAQQQIREKESEADQENCHVLTSENNSLKQQIDQYRVQILQVQKSMDDTNQQLKQSSE